MEEEETATATATAVADADAARGRCGGQRASATLLLLPLLALLLLVVVFLLSGRAESVAAPLAAFLAPRPLLGSLLFASTFLALFALLAPTTPMELLAGYVFGFRWAFLLLLALQPLAHSATFLVARRAGLLRVGGVLREHLRLFQAIELAVKDDPLAAWQMVFLVCISYMPAGPKVYGLAAMSSVRFHVLLVSAACACAPHSLVNAWLGSNLTDLSAIFRGGGSAGGGGEASAEERHMRLGILALNLVGLVGCLSAMAWYGKRSLDKLARQGGCGRGGCGREPLLPPTHKGEEEQAVHPRAPR